MYLECLNRLSVGISRSPGLFTLRDSLLLVALSKMTVSSRRRAMNRLFSPNTSAVTDHVHTSSLRAKTAAATSPLP